MVLETGPKKGNQKNFQERFWKLDKIQGKVLEAGDFPEWGSKNLKFFL